MKRWLHILFFSLILAYLGFKLTFLLLNETMILNRAIYLELEFKPDEALSYQASANSFPMNAGESVIKGELNSTSTKLVVPISRYEKVRRIFISFDQPAKIELLSLNFIGAYKTINTPSDSLAENVYIIAAYPSKPTPIGFDDQKLILKTNESHPIVAIDKAITSNFYDEITAPLRLIAFGLGILVFILAVFGLASAKWKIELGPKLSFCAFFIAIIFTPFLSQKENQTPENRKLADFPSLNQNIWKIPPKYTKFYNDRFPYRNLLKWSYEYVMIKAFKISPLPDFFQIGKEGWLFYSAEEAQRIYRGKQQFTPKQLEALKNKFETIEEELEKKDIKFYLMIPPMKHTVYPEFLPDKLKAVEGEMTKRQQLLKYLEENSDLDVIDPYPRLISLKDSIDTYYKIDTHWNQLAAFKIYQDLINVINKDFPEIGEPLTENDFKINKLRQEQGDLVNNLNLKGVFYGDMYELISKEGKKSGIQRFGKTIGDEQTYFYFESDSLKGKPRLLMYRDSFSEYLFPHVSEHFSYSSFAWSHNINAERVKKEQPDILIFETVERFLDELLEQ